MENNIIISEKQTLATYLREYRAKHGLTQDELAEQTGVSGPGISNIEVNGAKPRNDTMLKLAKGLGLPMQTIEAMASRKRNGTNGNGEVKKKYPPRPECPKGMELVAVDEQEKNMLNIYRTLTTEEQLTFVTTLMQKIL